MPVSISKGIEQKMGIPRSCVFLKTCFYSKFFSSGNPASVCRLLATREMSCVEEARKFKEQLPCGGWAVWSNGWIPGDWQMPRGHFSYK